MQRIRGDIYCIDAIPARDLSRRAMLTDWNKVIHSVQIQGKAHLLTVYSLFHLSLATTTIQGKIKRVDRQKNPFSGSGKIELQEYQHGAGWHIHALLWAENDAAIGALALKELWEQVNGGKASIKRCDNMGKVVYMLLQEVASKTTAWGYKGKQDKHDFFHRVRALLPITESNRRMFPTWQDNLQRGLYDLFGSDIPLKLQRLDETKDEKERKRLLKRLREIRSKRRIFAKEYNTRSCSDLARKMRPRLEVKDIDAFLELAMQQ